MSHGPRQEKARRSVPARLSACFLFVDESRYTVNNSQVAFYSKGVPPPPRRMRLTKSREKSASIYATISSVCSKVRSSCQLMVIATSPGACPSLPALHIRLRVHLASSKEQSGEDKSCGNGDGEAISNLAQSNRAQTMLCGIRLAASRARTELSGSVLLSLFRSSERRSHPWTGSIK